MSSGVLICMLLNDMIYEIALNNYSLLTVSVSGTLSDRPVSTSDSSPSFDSVLMDDEPLDEVVPSPMPLSNFTLFAFDVSVLSSSLEVSLFVSVLLSQFMSEREVPGLSLPK